MSRCGAFTRILHVRFVPDAGRVALVAFLPAALITGGGTLDAQEHAEQEATGGSGDDSVETESGSGDEGATEAEDKPKEKKSPSFVPVPIFITEPAIGYGLGGRPGTSTRKRTAAPPPRSSPRL